jgi:hypothetical protein
LFHIPHNLCRCRKDPYFVERKLYPNVDFYSGLVYRALGGDALTPGCQIGFMCDRNSTYGLHSLPGGVRLVTWNKLAVIDRCFDDAQ